MAITAFQWRKLMSEKQMTGKVGMAALRSGMDRKTARKYLDSGQPPSTPPGRDWRTREDPFAAHWAETEAMLQEAPELEAKALFEWLCEKHPGCYQEGQLRSFQRRLHSWRALKGPEQEICFAQVHRAGERMQTDFTHMEELGIIIAGQAFAHLLCHSVLPYSNWEWASVCHSESHEALQKGLQASLVRLGHVPQEHWTDHSTAATHQLAGESQGRGFNQRYLDLMAHFGLEPRTIAVAKPQQQGDVESLNGALKRRIEQHLLLRGSREFATRPEYRKFLEGVLDRCNQRRQKRLTEELAVMRPLAVELLPDYAGTEARVSRGSTIQVETKSYSLPSRLIGQRVAVRVYEERVEVYLQGQLQETMPRVGPGQASGIQYRHLVEGLLRKPGAFGQYRYREELFPRPIFRWAYEQLCRVCAPRVADLEYVRLLHRAARTMESEVAAALEQIRARGLVPRWATLLEFVPVKPVEHPEMAPLRVDLSGYDCLLEAAAAGGGA